MYNTCCLCRCDGIGRRSGLKIHRWRQRTGSSPVTGTTWSQSSLCDHVFLYPWRKKLIRPLPCSSFPNRTRFAGLRFGFGSNLETAVSILLRCFTSEQASYCLLRFFISSALPGPSAIFAPLCTTRYFYGIVGLSSSGNPTGLQAEVRGYAGISEPEPPGI